MTMMSTPLACESAADFAEGTGCHARWAERFQRANESAEQDAVFTLEAVVTRHGRLASLAVLRSGRHSTADDQVQLIEDLLEAVSRARLDPAADNGRPHTSNMLWLVEHATVRATKPPALVDVPLPPKKRAASLTDPVRVVRA
jgi:hypothetical protein